MVLSIRFSEILTRLKCRKKHKYEYIDEIEPVKLDDRILTGLWGHTGIQTLLKGGTEDDASSAIAEDIQKYVGEGQAIDQKYIEMGQLALNCAIEASKRLLKKFKPLMIEEQMVYEVLVDNETVRLTGTPDFVAEEIDTGLKWLFDHKFRNNFRQPDAELLNLQMTHYSYMLKMTKGIEVIGSKQFQIKPIVPKTPEVTKAGEVSRRPIISDWETYSAAVIANGQDINQYLDVKEKLADKKFYDMDSATAIRSWEEVESVFLGEIVPVVKEIINAHKTNGADSYRCWDFGSCNFCHFKPYCIADLKGEDLEYLRKTQYRKKGEILKVIELEE